jgi:acyl-CoA hydrolase
MSEKSAPAGEPPECVMTQIVLPGDSNSHGTAFGGRILQWIDLAAAVASMRHCRTRVVTASMDEVDFLAPIRVGMVVELRARVNAVFRSSMEVGVRIESEDPLTGERTHALSAYLTFVSQDAEGRPMALRPLPAVSPEERRREQEALRRRAVRLERAQRKRARFAEEEKG